MPSRSTISLAALATSLAALISLGGCGSDAPALPRPLAAAARSALSAPSLSTSRPAQRRTSAAARRPRMPPSPRSAARAVVRHYYRVISRLRVSMDPRPLSRLLAPRCSCHSLVADVRRTAAAHERYVGTTRLAALRPSSDGPGHADVLVQYSSSGAGIVAADGSYLRRSHAVVGATLDFRLRRVGRHWLISEIDLVDRGSR